MFRSKKYLYAVLTLAGLSVLFGGKLAKPLMAQVKAALVRDIDNPALNPVQLVLTLNQSGGFPQYTGSLNIPFGKRMVVESVAIKDNNPGSSLGFVDVNFVVNGVSAWYSMPLQYTIWSQNGNLNGRYYVDAGGGMTVHYGIPGGVPNDTTKTVYISGYYVTP